MIGPRILPANNESIQEAAADLERGSLVVFPTETVYGLGGGTLDESSLASIYRLKGRQSDNPLIAHVLDIEGARSLTTGWDDRCTLLAEAWWPGPLTLVLGRSGVVPDLASGGRPTLAVRSPQHPVARALLEAYGKPISAPSANRSGEVSPTCAQHVLDDYSADPAADGMIILDGDRCHVGIESTVLDMTVDPPRILRPGALTAEVLQNLIGSVEYTELHHTSASPGTMESHYSPQTNCLLVDVEEMRHRLSNMTERCVVLVSNPDHHEMVQPPHTLLAMPSDPDGYAQDLYDALRKADSEQADLILIESNGEEDPNWIAIRDRLMRAASDRPV
ncbi:MAG: threonylcarbamoyl-AMP synthase [Phycisphaerae bacterium]|nr:threonylcarbamoyl-AMP synthase [Phycisphaerae bacterium]|tara:strand:+ start:5764 stop:6765 length:1002 start_codon:yes stop_codon:yes gene_type:complete